MLMKKQPIGIFVRPYRGQDDNKRRQSEKEARTAIRIEEFLNGKMKDGEDQVFSYADIAAEIGVEEELVARLLFPVRGGNFSVLV